MRVFISQSMGGIPDDEVLAERNRAIENIKQKYGENIEVLESLFEDEPPEYTVAKEYGIPVVEES